MPYALRPWVPKLLLQERTLEEARGSWAEIRASPYSSQYADDVVYVQVDLTLTRVVRPRGNIKILELPPGHQVCPQISTRGKACGRHVGHGRHIINEKTEEVLGISYRFRIMKYICECGHHTSTREDMKKHLIPLAKRWAVTRRQVSPVELRVYEVTRLTDYTTEPMDHSLIVEPAILAIQ